MMLSYPLGYDLFILQQISECADALSFGVARSILEFLARYSVQAIVRARGALAVWS